MTNQNNKKDYLFYAEDLKRIYKNRGIVGNYNFYGILSLLEFFILYLVNKNYWYLNKKEMHIKFYLIIAQ